MLGLSDSGIYLPYVLSIVSAVGCVVYGILYWNKGAEINLNEKKLKWAEQEKEIEKDFE